MTNRTVWLTAFGVIYVAGAAGVVHLQGEAYRGRLSRQRQGDAVALLRPIPPAERRPIGETPASSVAVEPTGSEPPSVAPERKTKPTPTLATVKPEPAPEPQPAAKLPDLIVANLDKLSAEEESRLGKLLHLLIVANHGADLDNPYQRAVTAAAQPIIDRRSRRNVEVTITVLDSNEVNAFSHLGGYLYVTRGLFNLAATPEEFRFVVGHELAHEDLRHGQALVAEATRAGELNGVGTLQALYHQIAVGYTEAQENEADDWVIDQMNKLDHTKRESLGFLRRLVGLSEQNGYRNGRKPPKTATADAVQDVDNYYRSQPAAWKRLSRLEGRFKTPPTPIPPRSAPATAR